MVVSWSLLTIGNARSVGVTLISSTSAAILCGSAHFGVCAYGSICFSLCSSSRLGTNLTLRTTIKPSWRKNLGSVAAHQIVVSLKFIALNWKWHIQCYHKTVNPQKPGRRMNPLLVRNQPQQRGEVTVWQEPPCSGITPCLNALWFGVRVGPTYLFQMPFFGSLCCI